MAAFASILRSAPTAVMMPTLRRRPMPRPVLARRTPAVFTTRHPAATQRTVQLCQGLVQLGQQRTELPEQLTQVCPPLHG
jgi:hypothetical protein